MASAREDYPLRHAVKGQSVTHLDAIDNITLLAQPAQTHCAGDNRRVGRLAAVPQTDAFDGLRSSCSTVDG